METAEATAKPLLSIPIFDSGRHDGEGKSRNVTAAEIQRTDITNRNDGLFHIDVSMVTCVHGVWSGEDRTPASFIVFHCEINSLEDYYVKKVKLQWEFVNDQVSAPSNPTIAARGPHLVRKYNSSDVDHHDEIGIDAGIEAETIVNPGLNFHWNGAKDYKKQYFETARSGVEHASEKDHRYTKAWWIYTQNKQTKQGISAGFRIAVLIKRQNDSPFKGLFTLIEFDAGWKYKAAIGWKDFFAKRPPNVDDPVNFDPTVERVGGKDIDKDALGALKTDTGIGREYAWIWGVDVE
ncbi:hypothetical protein G7Y89_g11704 [Cudoniella acicularis]|uniref:Uncharacterized protein n=1 Tax=Cudoniella acicularis TaxID=354080 RepID=A0A8H4RCZ3_9HELO|nr:hypothetical protein G7Y89_g11704 [Cudoniella acicularis]